MSLPQDLRGHRILQGTVLTFVEELLCSELSASYCYLILPSQQIYQFGVKIPRSHSELNWNPVYLGSLSALLFFPYCFPEALWFTPGRTCPVTYAIVCPCCVIPQRLCLCSCRSHPLSCLGRALCSLLSPAVHVLSWMPFTPTPAQDLDLHSAQ